MNEIRDRLHPTAIVRSPLFPEPVRVILTQPVGPDLKLIGTGMSSGKTYQHVLSAAQMAMLQVSPEQPPFDGDATRFKWGVEALRLGLAYEYDPYFALSIARIDPLPHQLEAVYHYFIKSPRIRFLLADDPGAGKTIMAGLLIQELKARGLVKRVLIVAPANLTFQWQRELRDKFRQQFEVVRGDVLRSHYGANPFQEKDQVITPVSWVSRIEDANDSLLRSEWDLVIVDEAHKMSAYRSGPDGKENKTLAYQLGEALSSRSDHYLLMTATPHKGDPDNFSLFLRLLDEDVYGDITSLQEAMRRQEAPFYLRRVKEALVTFPDPDSGEVKTLFTRRDVRTIDFKIDADEWDFYNALTRFVEEQSIQAAAEGGARGRAIGFTMAMLQRRFASSLYAVRRTLERMKRRREKILSDPARYRYQQIQSRAPDDFDDLTAEEQEAILLERMLREMYAHNLSDAIIIDRIVEQVDATRFRAITESTLEGLAKHELNLSAIVGRCAEAKERRLVPEVIEDFFVRAGPLAGVFAVEAGQPHIYRLGRVPRALLRRGQTLEPRFGKLGREYRRIAFAKETLRDDATLEWVTPGHPLFEALRGEIWEQSQLDLKHGAVFFDLNRDRPGALNLFAVAIADGRGRTLHRRLFVVETRPDGASAMRQPTIFLDLIPAQAGATPPATVALPELGAVEASLYTERLNGFLAEVQTEREREIDRVSQHVEISLAALIDRQNLRLGDLLIRQQEGGDDPLLAANIKQAEERLDTLESRRDSRRAELAQERHCAIADIHHLGRSWVLPHPDRQAPNLAPMVRDDAIERIAMNAATAYEQGRGWQVEDVSAENKGFDLISRRFGSEDPTTPIAIRYIEVKGRAHVGLVSLSQHEYNTAHRLKSDYWLYTVFNCATTPQVHPICNPVHLPWEPMQQIIQYRVSAEAVMDEAALQSGPLSPVEAAFQAAWQSRLADLGEYNILVEGLSDKVYLELAAQKHREATGVDLLEGGRVRVIAGRGSKRFAPDFGLLQSLEGQGIRFVAILDGDEPGAAAAGAMQKFGAQKNRHFFQLQRPDFADKAGKSWDVEIEDMLPWPLIERFIATYPTAAASHYPPL